MDIAPVSLARIFCIGKNYADHIAEMGGPPAEQCVIFMKPLSALVPVGEPVPLPRGRGAVHHEAEVVVRLRMGGRDIARDKALPHVDGVTLGLDLTLRDEQAELKKKGHPWERAKAFDFSAPLGSFRPPEGIDLGNLTFTCAVNGTPRQAGNSAQMLFPVDRLIEVLSGLWELMPGDLIFTGTPAGVGPVVPGDRVEVSSPELGAFAWDFV